MERNEKKGRNPFSSNSTCPIFQPQKLPFLQLGGRFGCRHATRKNPSAVPEGILTPIT